MERRFSFITTKTILYEIYQLRAVFRKKRILWLKQKKEDRESERERNKERNRDNRKTKFKCSCNSTQVGTKPLKQSALYTCKQEIIILYLFKYIMRS